MRHYCTLFDANYLVKGLVLYNSLAKHSSEPFRLHVLAMDDKTAETLRAMALPNMLVTDLDTFELCHWEMKNCRANRSWLEYLWTCGSNFAAYLMFQAIDDLPEITYLDADMMFFSDPKVIFDELNGYSIGVIPHRLIPSKKHLEVNGLFNVSWVYFRNDKDGMRCLERWAEQCRNRCSEKHGCGDQLYLNEFPLLWPKACRVIENIGAGLAPWNYANYELMAVEGRCSFMVSDNESSGEWRTWEFARFVHYHEFQETDPGKYRLTNYELRTEDMELIYLPYIAAYEEAKALLQQPA